MFRKFWTVALLALTALTASAGTFGTVVPIGGQAADIALDEARGVLYVANFTANRIDVMSLSNNVVQTSINVASQPSSISLSPDDHWLLVAQYGNNTTGTQTNGLTLIDLTNANAKQTFVLSSVPLGVAFGSDDKALVVTSTSFILFDPSVGTTQVLQTIAQVATSAIPQPTASFPGNIVQASVATSRDGNTIAGFGGNSPYLLFRYSVLTHTITGSFYVSTPPAGPRTVSLSDDGTLASFAWWLSDANFITTAEFPTPSGLLNVGSSVIDSSRNLVYAEIPSSTSTSTTPPILGIYASDNLTLIEQINLPENLAGKAVLTANHNTMYSISDSGVLVLPVGNLSAYPRLSASVEDVVFRGNFCNRNAITQTFTITDPGGNHTPFSLSTSTSGISFSPSSGVTPATITVSADPNAFASQKGTVTAAIVITSSTSIDLSQTVRVLVNSQDPSQRGTFIDVPGNIVDLLADPKRSVYYVLRQDKNEVLVFNSTNNTQTATLRTCSKPTGMAITFDQQDLLIGCDSSHYLDVYDLDLLTAQTPVAFESDYVESVAASSNAILAVIRSGIDGHAGIDQINLLTHTGSALPTLGVWQNKLGTTNSVVAASSNGAQILMAGTDGWVMIYDANANTFTASRKDFSSLGGAYAVSNFGQFVVGNTTANVMLDSSGAPAMTLPISGGFSSGFAFVNQAGYSTATAATSTSSNPTWSPGVISQIDVTDGNAIQPTYTVEAPTIGNYSVGIGNYGAASTCTTSTTGTTTTTVCSSTTSGITTQTTDVCTGAGTGNSSCTTTSTSGPANTTVAGFTRSLAPLPNQSAIISLSTSGITVLPWNYAASVAPPQISSVVSAADGVSPAAPGGLVSLYGNQLSPTNLATSQIPVPTALANSCVTVNGQPVPLIFVSPNQINAQMPSEAVGDVTVQVHTPGGESDNYNMVVVPNAPAVFLSAVAGPETNLPTVMDASDNLLVTDSNPVHRGDTLVIYLTGCGQTAPIVPDGQGAPSSPLAIAITPPTVTLGNATLSVSYAGLTPGQVGLCQINATVPGSTPLGLSMPLNITQGTFSKSVSLRVIQ